MAKILAFAGSNSSTSINYQLVKHTSTLIKEQDVELINMANFPFPMYSEDYEKEHGYSNALIELKNDINKANAIILSVNEHNSHPSAFFKNILDWLSRVERDFLANTKILLMATSPGKGGAKHSLAIVEKMLPRLGGEIIATFSLPSFLENYDKEKGITNAELIVEHKTALDNFLASI